MSLAQMESSTSDSEEIIRSAEQVAREEIAPRASEYDAKGEFPYASYEALRKVKLTAMVVPREFGGLGVDQETYCRVLSIIARACGSTALTLNMHSSVLRQINAMGNESQKKRFLSEAAAGKLFASLTSEPSSSLRRNFRVETTARPVEDGYVVDGFKYFCSLSVAADYFFLWTMPPGKNDLEKDLVNLVVPADSKGVSVEQTWDVMAMRATASHSVRFDNVTVPAENAVGGSGGAVRHDLADVYMPGYAAVYFGLAEAAYESAVDYAQNRKFGGVPIAEDPVIQHQIAEMNVQIEAARQMTLRAARLVDDGERKEAILAQNQAKYLACETARSVADRALRIIGGGGLSRKKPFERIFRDAHVGMIMPPSSDHTLETIGKLSLGFDAAGGFLG